MFEWKERCDLLTILLVLGQSGLVVVNIEFLNFLDQVERFGSVGALPEPPEDISKVRDNGNEQHGEPE